SVRLHLIWLNEKQKLKKNKLLYKKNY
ncbi:MAG: hypothetical protein CFH30_00318, partial [Alphaproteobacteria bacterium MarineAlpha8_Bin1]